MNISNAEAVRIACALPAGMEDERLWIWYRITRALIRKSLAAETEQEFYYADDTVGEPEILKGVLDRDLLDVYRLPVRKILVHPGAHILRVADHLGPNRKRFMPIDALFDVDDQREGLIEIVQEIR